MTDFNKRIDSLVKIAIEVKKLASIKPNDSDLGHEVRKLILRENDLLSNKTRKSVQE